jgi:hypothetical protein
MGKSDARSDGWIGHAVEAIARSEATKQSILSLRGGMDCFASLAMTAKHSSLLLSRNVRDVDHGPGRKPALTSPARWTIHRLRGDQHMRDDQELSIDELSAVVGGATSTSGGFHPKPPVDIIKWILSLLK